MEVTGSSETSVDFQFATRRYIPEDRTLQFHNRFGSITTAVETASLHTETMNALSYGTEVQRTFHVYY
jgi:hypothetical protein